MKYDVEYVCQFLKKHELSPELLELEYNSNNTRACISIGGTIKAANYMKIENAIKFKEEIRKRFYGKVTGSIKRIK